MACSTSSTRNPVNALSWVDYNGNSELLEKEFIQKFRVVTAQYPYLAPLTILNFLKFTIFTQLKKQKICSDKELNDYFMCLNVLSTRLDRKVILAFDQNMARRIEFAEPTSNIIIAVERNQTHIERKLDEKSTHLAYSFSLLRRLVISGNVEDRLKLLGLLVVHEEFTPHIEKRTLKAKEILEHLKDQLAYQKMRLRYCCDYPVLAPGTFTIDPEGYSFIEKAQKFLDKDEFIAVFNKKLTPRQVMEKCARLAFECLGLRGKINYHMVRLVRERDLKLFCTITVLNETCESIRPIEKMLLEPLHYSPNIAFRNFSKNMELISESHLLEETEKREISRNVLLLEPVRESIVILAREVLEFIQTTIKPILDSDEYKRAMSVQSQLHQNMGTCEDKKESYDIKIMVLQMKCLQPLRREVNDCYQRTQMKLTEIKSILMERLQWAEEPLNRDEIESEIEDFLASSLALPLSIIMDARKLNGDAYAVENTEFYHYPEEFLSLASLDDFDFSIETGEKVKEEIILEVEAPQLEGDAAGSSFAASQIEEEKPQAKEEYLTWESILEDFYPGLQNVTKEQDLLRIIRDDFDFVRQKGSHKIYKHKKSGQIIILAAHSTKAHIPRGLFNEIKKTIGEACLMKLKLDLDQLEDNPSRSKHKEKLRQERMKWIQARIKVLEERLS